MKPDMHVKRLPSRNVAHALSGGRSVGNRVLRFRPAFLDFGTQTLYPSCYADGRPAPFHVLDGLPEEVVVDRTVDGRVVAVKVSVIAGFERNGFFYTRTAALRAVAQWAGPEEFQE